MTRAWSAALLLLLCGEALAADWQFLGDYPDGTKFYVDQSSIEFTPPLLRLWIKVDEQPGETQRTVRYLFFNCKDRTVGVRHTVDMGADGRARGGYDAPLPRFEPIVPESFNEGLLTRFCPQ